jgi:hypothetical protein
MKYLAHFNRIKPGSWEQDSFGGQIAQPPSETVDVVGATLTVDKYEIAPSRVNTTTRRFLSGGAQL